MIRIPCKFRPLLTAVVLIAVGGFAIFLIDLFDLGGAPERCCAGSFDARPHEWVPAR